MEIIYNFVGNIWQLMFLMILLVPTFWILSKLLGFYGNTTKKTIKKFKS